MEARKSAAHSPGREAPPRYVHVAVTLSFAAELIHLWAVPELYAVWRVHTAFLLVVAMGQGALGVSLLFGPGKRTIRLGILFNLFVVFVWTFTRTVGVPDWLAFMRLPVGVPDLVATAAELALVLVLVKLRWDLVRGRV